MIIQFTINHSRPTHPTFYALCLTFTIFQKIRVHFVCVLLLHTSSQKYKIYTVHCTHMCVHVQIYIKKNKKIPCIFVFQLSENTIATPNVSMTLFLSLINDHRLSLVWVPVNVLFSIPLFFLFSFCYCTTYYTIWPDVLFIWSTSTSTNKQTNNIYMQTYVRNAHAHTLPI